MKLLRVRLSVFEWSQIPSCWPSTTRINSLPHNRFILQTIVNRLYIILIKIHLLFACTTDVYCWMFTVYRYTVFRSMNTIWVISFDIEVCFSRFYRCNRSFGPFVLIAFGLILGQNLTQILDPVMLRKPFWSFTFILLRWMASL